MASVSGSTAEDAPPIGRGARLALATLVALAILTPWAAGGVDPAFTRGIAVASLAAALVAVALDARSGTPAFAAMTLDERSGAPAPASLPLWPLGALWLVAALQLVPLPSALLRVVASGPAGVWCPSVPEAAAVLGDGLRPISLHPEATRRWLALATGIVTLALAAVPALRERRLLLRAALAIVANGVLLTLYALVARLVFGNKLYGIWSVPTVAPFGPFVNKNHFAGYVELTALLAVGLAAGLASEARRGPDALSWIESRRARWVIAAWGAAAILVLAVPVSLSRGGVVSLSAGLAAFAALRLWPRLERRFAPKRVLVAAAAALVVVAGLVAVLPDEARARVLTLTGVTSEESGSFRLGVWRDTLRLVASSPWLGSGLGAYEDALPRFKTVAGHLAVEHAENDYLELLAEGGLAAGLSVALVAVLLLRSGARAATRAHERLPRALAAGALAGLIALTAHSAFDFNLHIPSNALCALTLAAVAMGAAGDSPRSTMRWPLPTIAALSLALALLAPWATQGFELRSLLRATHTGTSLRRMELTAALQDRLHRRPADAPAWLALAWLSLPTSPATAHALAGWAVALDPASEALSAARTRMNSSRR